MSPDPSRLAPLLEFPIPETCKELERFIGMMVYYSKWVKNFAELAKPLYDAKETKSFPLNANCKEAISLFKSQIAEATLAVPRDEGTLTLETDASTLSVGAVLMGNQFHFTPTGCQRQKRSGHLWSWKRLQLCQPLITCANSCWTAISICSRMSKECLTFSTRDQKVK